MKNKKRFWIGWRKEAADTFNISISTVDLWLKKGKPELIFWLKEKINERNEKDMQAKIIKDMLINSYNNNNENTINA